MSANRVEQFSLALKKALGEILPRLCPETPAIITDVLVNPSLREARVWLSVKPGQLKTITAKRPAIQGEVSNRLKVRYTPKLEFVIDDGYLNHMDEIFSSLNSLNEN